MDIKRTKEPRFTDWPAKVIGFARHDAPEAAPDINSVKIPRSKPTLAQRAWKLTRNTIIASLAASTFVGAIGVANNYDALTAPLSASNPVQTVTPTPRPTPVPAPSNVQPVLPQAAATQLFAELQESKQMKKLLADQMATVQAQVQKQLQHLPAFQDTQLLDVSAPLPTGDGSLLAVGSLQLPSLGIHNLQTQTVPVVASTNVQLGPLQARITTDPVQVPIPKGGPPGGVYLGSFHTQVVPTAPTLSIAGDVHVALDLDGKATLQQLGVQKLRLAAAPAGSAEAVALQQNVDRLTQRLAAGQHLAQVARRAGIEQDMQKAMEGQGSSFKTDIALSQSTPLVDGYDHLWLVPGDGNGPPHIVVTDQLSTPGLDNLSVPTPKLSALPQQGSNGLVLNVLHHEVGDLIQKQIAKTFGQVASTIPATAHDTVSDQWSGTRVAIQSTANDLIDKVFAESTQVTLAVTNTLEPVPAGLAPSAATRLPFKGAPLPAVPLQQIFTAVQHTPAFQKALNARIDEARAQVQKQLDALPAVQQRNLVDAEVTLPPDIAAVAGSKTLSVPMVVDESGQVSPIKVRVDVAPVTVKDVPHQDGMVYLGSYRTSVYSQSPVAHVKGQALVALDLDGKATQQALDTAQAEARGVDPHSARGQALNTNIQRLEARLAASRHLSHLIGPFAPQLAKVVGNQGLTASFDIPLPQDKPLLVGTANIFVAPGGPQGLPQVVVTQDLSTPGIDSLKPGKAQLGAIPHVAGHDVLERMHQALAGNIQQAGAGLVARAGQSLPGQVRDQAQDAWRQAISGIQSEANDAIASLVKQQVAPLDLGTPPAAPTTGTYQSTQPLPRTTGAPAGSMAVVVPADTVARIVSQVENSPEVQAQIRAATADAQAQLAQPQTQDGEDLIDVKGPGGLDLPLVIAHHVTSGALPARVQITPLKLTPAQIPKGPPGAVYLASYQSEVWATQTSLQASGRVTVSLDTDGRATEAQLKTLQAKAAGSGGRDIQSQIQSLQQRLASIRQLQGLQLPPDAQKAVDALTHQQLSVQTTATLPTDRPLIRGVDHLWLTADGVQVTTELQTPGATGIGLQNTQLTAIPHAVPAGFEPFQKLIMDRLQSQGQAAVGQVTSQFPARMTQLTQGAWDKTTGTLQSSLNAEVKAFFASHGNVRVPLGDGTVASPLKVGLVGLTPAGNGGVAAIVQTPGGHETFNVKATQPAAGVIDTTVSGDSVNGLLRDKSQGGNVDWQGLLKSLAQANNIKSLTFNHDAQGNLLTPHLVMRNGQIRAEFDMTAEVGGLRPIGTVTGAINGATKPLSHSPLSFLHAVTGGIETVMDHTVGVVVDTLPDLATRPVVTMHVSVPLQFVVHNGVLTIRPDTRGLEVSDGQGSSGKVLLPTQWIGSAIGQSMIQKEGPAKLAPALNQVAIPVDLRPYGVNITGADPLSTTHTTPNLDIKARLAPDFNIENLAGLSSIVFKI